MFKRYILLTVALLSLLTTSMASFNWVPGPGPTSVTRSSR